MVSMSPDFHRDFWGAIGGMRYQPLPYPAGLEFTLGRASRSYQRTIPEVVSLDGTRLTNLASI